MPPLLGWCEPQKNPPVTAEKDVACQPHSLQVRCLDSMPGTIPSALITVATPARTTNLTELPSDRRSAGDSQAHSLSALVSGFHLTPTLWTPL